jgi:hypothetical protein
MRVHAEFGLDVSVATLKRTLDSLLFTHKQVTRVAMERNELLRAAFKCRFAELVHNLNMLLCIDESSKDERTVSRRWGYARLGKRCPVRTRFIRGTRYSILPVMGIDGYLAYEVFEGPVTGERFIGFLREHVVSFSFTSVTVH